MSLKRKPSLFRLGALPPFLLLLVFFITLQGALSAHADDSPYPPPGGKAWIRSGGKWVMVPAPPNEGPYRWNGSEWARIENIPPNRKWIPPHWDEDGDRWVMGHWKLMRSEDENQIWVSGHWANNGQWIEGRWEEGKNPSSGVSDETWIPGVNIPRPPLRPHPPLRPRPPGSPRR